MRKFLVIAALLFCVFSGFAQENIQEKETFIFNLFESLKKENVDSLRLNICEEIEKSLQGVLKQESSFTYPFEEVINLGKITSPDNKLRVFTWNCNLSNGEYKYFGFIQIKNKSGITLVKLRDQFSEKDLFRTLRPENWIGALYYQIVPFKSKAGSTYLLLGWDGNNMSTTKKLIEVLRFDKKGNVYFGMPVIEWRGKMLHRVIFEYAKQARMSIQYQEKEKRLVFDHLSPSSPKYQNQFEYYGPDFSYDALQYRKGKWTLIENIDIRNSKK